MALICVLLGSNIRASAGYLTEEEAQKFAQQLDRSSDDVAAIFVVFGITFIISGIILAALGSILIIGASQVRFIVK
jgi:hypothetical protein